MFWALDEADNPNFARHGFVGINQRNIASRRHWTQPQTCEPRHFLTPSTERNNYQASDTVRALVGPPPIQYQARDTVTQACCSHCVLAVAGRTDEKGLAACPQGAPKYIAAAATWITDRGRASCQGRPALARPATFVLFCRRRPGRIKDPTGPWARVTASATVKHDHTASRGPAH